jgi:hypothetical protein
VHFLFDEPGAITLTTTENLNPYGERKRPITGMRDRTRLSKLVSTNVIMADNTIVIGVEKFGRIQATTGISTNMWARYIP